MKVAARASARGSDAAEASAVGDASGSSELGAGGFSTGWLDTLLPKYVTPLCSMRGSSLLAGAVEASEGRAAQVGAKRPRVEGEYGAL